MNHKKLLFFTFFSTVFLLLLGNNQGIAQASHSRNTFEDVYEHWEVALNRFQSTTGIKSDEYAVFIRFSQKGLDSLRGDFMNKIANGNVTLTNVKEYEDILLKNLNAIYSKFKKIEQLYPSSVDEYRHYTSPMAGQICDSACDNIDFETGDLSGWYAYYALNMQPKVDFNVTNITGGLAGAVKHAANDVLTSTNGDYVPLNQGFYGPNPSPDYQVNITSGSRGDALVPSIPVVSPFGGHYSVMLGDSTQINYGVAILSQTFKVGVSNANFTYQYAVFLANPNHTRYNQPFFTIAVLDQAGDTIPHCGEYNVVSGNGTQKFDSLQYYDAFADEDFVVYYKNWTMVNVPLTKYIGQCVTIVFEIADCAQGGHFGYAYVDASCSPLEIQASSPNFCGQDSITLTGPAGEGQYYWMGPPQSIRGSDTLRQINVDSVGTYTLVVTPFTGATCNDTLTIKIGKKAGPPPHPDFKADTGCVNLSVPFLNTSTPIAGANFYWDFYNTGTYEDSTVNATWVYNGPGIYQVKLHELYNGCGMDTTIKIVIDSISSSSFIADTVCVSDTTQFTNTSTGGITYYWNFGDTPSGINNTSVKANPVHAFSAPGTYTVSLIAKHLNWCNDTAKERVVVLPEPKLDITGTDSLCYGSSAVLSVSSGRASYLWNTGATTSSITVNPTTPTTYSVQASNGRCTVDTSFTLYIKPLAPGAVTGKGTVCFGDTVVLIASGGGTYLWSTGATTSSITVNENSFNDTAYSVTINNGKNCVDIHKKINIDSLFGYACCNDTIYTGDSVVLNASDGIKYYWIPPTGLSCDTCPDPVASPTATTVYTLITTSYEGCIKSSDVLVDVKIPCRDFFIPNVFTPNGDGVNDTYLIKVEYMSLYEISIYNRWGQEVFHSTDPASPWDGSINGNGGDAPAGVYYYIVRTTCFDGNSFHKQGFLQLIR